MSIRETSQQRPRKEDVDHELRLQRLMVEHLGKLLLARQQQRTARGRRSLKRRPRQRNLERVMASPMQVQMQMRTGLLVLPTQPSQQQQLGGLDVLKARRLRKRTRSVWLKRMICIYVVLRAMKRRRRLMMIVTVIKTRHLSVADVQGSRVHNLMLKVSPRICLLSLM